MSDQGLFSVTELRRVPCSHGPTGHARLGSAENLNISIFLCRILVTMYCGGNLLTRPDTKKDVQVSVTAVNAHKVCTMHQNKQTHIDLACETAHITVKMHDHV